MAAMYSGSVIARPAAAAFAKPGSSMPAGGSPRSATIFAQVADQRVS
jgi:hypothetical protein